MLVLFLLFFAIGCENGRTLDNKAVGVATFRLTTLSDLAYPLSSMTAWTNENYGACGSSYFTNYCHNGADIMTNVGTSVHAITDGTVIAVSATQDTPSCTRSYWGYNATANTCNMALAILHKDASNNDFIAIYGHLQYDSSIQPYKTTVTTGQQIGVIGPWPYGNHLHLSIIPGKNLPA